MVPVNDNDDFIHINGVPAILLSWAKSRGGDLGLGMWSCNGQALGWIEPAPYPMRCVGAELQLSGKLTPRWEEVPDGWRLIHPRYTLAAAQTPQGWLPTISDELTKRSHSLAIRPTRTDAMKVLDTLLQRRVGREPPPFGLHQWFGDCDQYDDRWQFQLAMDLAGPVIADLIRHRCSPPIQCTGNPPQCATQLASFFDKFRGFDAAARLATILATYIKAAALDIYQGRRSIAVTANGLPVTFTDQELKAFRDQFRRAPLTDDEYLAFTYKHFIAPLEPLRRRKGGRWRRLRKFHPRQDDIPFCHTGKPGARLFKVERTPKRTG
jgi:hypothetical protein